MPQKKERTLLKMEQMTKNLNEIMNTLNNVLERTNTIESDIKDIKDTIDKIEKIENEGIISIEKV